MVLRSFPSRAGRICSASHRNPLRAHEFDLVQHWYPPWLWLSRTSATPAYRVIQRPMQIVGQSRKGHPTPGKEERPIRTSASCGGCRSLQFTHGAPRREFIPGTMPHRSVNRALTRESHGQLITCCGSGLVWGPPTRRSTSFWRHLTVRCAALRGRLCSRPSCPASHSASTSVAATNPRWLPKVERMTIALRAFA
jgi:hypothetical protein